jgi:predicted phage tail protein
MTKDELTVFPLPSPPMLEFPEDKSLVGDEIQLKWEKSDDAMIYRLEVALDKTFVKLVKTEKLVKNSYKIDDLPPGTYYWRVASINRLNLEGTHLKSWSFQIKETKKSILVKKEPELKKEPEKIVQPVVKEEEKEEIVKKESKEDENESLKDKSPAFYQEKQMTVGSILLLSLITVLAL